MGVRLEVGWRRDGGGGEVVFREDLFLSIAMDYSNMVVFLDSINFFHRLLIFFCC